MEYFPLEFMHLSSIFFYNDKNVLSNIATNIHSLLHLNIVTFMLEYVII